MVMMLQQVLDSIVCASEGDLRKAITFLQSAHHLRGGEGIRERDVVEIAGVSPSFPNVLC